MRIYMPDQTSVQRGWGMDKVGFLAALSQRFADGRTQCLEPSISYTGIWRYGCYAKASVEFSRCDSMGDVEQVIYEHEPLSSPSRSFGRGHQG